MIKGITVQLYEREKTGEDPFGKAIYEESPVDVENVLVGEPETQAVVDEMSLSGKRIAYTLAIPKGDTHDWRDKKVAFFGGFFHTFGDVTEGIEANIPLAWNRKVKVERYG